MSEHIIELDESEYERGKLTRVMPNDLKELGRYALRWKMSPLDNAAFAVEARTIVAYVEKLEAKHVEVGHILELNAADRGLAGTATISYFNAAGFLIVKNEIYIPDFSKGEEVGYFAGSQDPWDRDLAEIVESSRMPRALVTAGSQ